ncbi:MAG TPA: DUF6603 domain-containing protein, partial [Longimicrobium sp.]
GRLRVDAGRRALAGGAAEPARPSRALSARVQVERAGGWLVGGPDATTAVRLRRAELGVEVEPGAGGGAAVRPVVKLYDAGAEPEALLEDLLEKLPSLPRLLPLGGSAPLAGTAPAWLVDALEALGVLVRDATGALALAMDELAALGTDIARFGARLPALLNLVAVADGDLWRVRPADAPVELVIERDPWRVAVRLRDASTGAATLALGPGMGLAAEAGLTLPAFAASASARLELADARVAWSTASGAVTLEALPWLAPVALVPPAPAPVLRAALARAVPVLAASSAVGGVLGGLLGPGARVRGIGRLLTSPGAWLASPDALGAADGSGLDPARVNALLATVGEALGMDTAGGLHLPGGFVLSAGGQAPLTLRLAGKIEWGEPEPRPRHSLELRLEMAIDRALGASPAGTATVDVRLPGGWQRVAITVGADASGLSLSVKPGVGDPITLLPTFSGFGALAQGAAALLPTVLQELVDARAADAAQPGTLLNTALRLAEALGIYGFDEDGFLRAVRVETLQGMVKPGWLDEVTSSAPALIRALQPVLASPALGLPGTITKAEDAASLFWELPISTGGTLTARLGWNASREAPAIAVGVKNRRLGPVFVETVSAGYDGELRSELRLGVETDGVLAFLRPELEMGVDAGRFTLSLFPLGDERRDELAVRIAPDPAVVLGPGGAMALVERWGVPLAGNLLLRTFADRLDTKPWSDGPSVRQVLVGAGVIDPAASPPVLAAQLPTPAHAALGALKAAAKRVEVRITDDLRVSLVEEEGRRGIRLQGAVALGDTLGLRFGQAQWLGDDAGVTLWLLAADDRIAPVLDVAGLGVVMRGENGAPLLDGAFQVGRAGGFLFLESRFTEGGRPALSVSRLGAGAELHGARIRVSPDGSDGFLGSILPPELQAPFDLGVAWRDGEGLALYGGTPGKDGLELTFPLELDLSVIRLAELFVALRARDSAAQVEGAVSGSASLGLVRAAVQRVGVKATLGSGGVQVGFRPPDGVGIAIDAGVVVGGGYLEVDAERGHYAGAVTLQMQGLSLAAIGILSTRGPGGEALPGGFSLLVVISAELPPVQLGFGFTLNGIGGLLGLNRTINAEALRAGVRSRGLDAILFPPDPVGNAPALVRTLGTVFPVAAGRFVVGPMVRLGWGTPPILTLDLGILIELPAPVVVAVLGRMRLVLPREEAAVVLIHMDVAGVVDFDRGEVSIDAELYDSFIAGFALSGGMALRARWKDKPTFALSVGGFHPAYVPPAGFPTLNRLALSLSSGNNPRLRMEAYLAVTSNTVQFGAGVDLHAEALGFVVDGHLSFDALIYLDPFGLDVSLEAAVSVKWKGHTLLGVALHLRVRGPGPWHIQGSARVEVLLFSATVRFDARIGKAAPPPPPLPVRVEALLRQAVAAHENWTAQPPAGEAVVVLRSPAGRARPAAHPLGGLTLRQRVVPLGVEIERFGAAGVEGPRRFSITGVRLGDDPVDEKQLAEVRDPFAAGQFFSLTESQKLSRPGFEPFVSGVSLSFDGFEVDGLAAAEAAVLGYKVVVVDEEEDGGDHPPLVLDAGTAAGLAHGGAAALAESRRAGARRFAAPAATIAVRERGFTVAPASATGSATTVTAPTFTEALQTAERLAGAAGALAGNNEES